MIETVKKAKGLGIRRFFARRMARQASKKVMSPSNPREVARKRIDAGGDRVPSAPGVAIEAIEYAGRPALKMTPPEARNGAILFLHGGGYSLGSPQSHKPFVSRLAAKLRLPAISLDYRLAPEHACPAAIDDASAALAQLVEEVNGPVLVAGDSAGGGLSLATVIAHRDAGRRMPAALYLISPWVDLSGSGASVQTHNALDPMLKADFLSKGASMYLGGRDPQDPMASPLFAELKDLPPTLIQVGEHEILLDDSRRLYERLIASGVPARCEVWAEMFHDFQLFHPLLTEAGQALTRVSRWADAHV